MANSADDVPQLIVVDPAELRGTVLLLSRSEIVVGHSDTGDLILDDSYGSRRLALITIDDSGSVTIRDLNSVGGTFVNDVWLEGPRVLQRGDLLRFADLVARFEPGSTSPPGAPSLRDSPTRPLPAPASAKPVPLAVVKPPMPVSPPDAAAADAGAADAEAAQPSPALAVTMPLAPALRPAAATGPAVTDLAPVLGTGSSELIAGLAGHGITTLADVRQAGDLSAITTPAQAAAVQLIASHADLARLSSDVNANAAIIAAGFGSTLAIARAPQFVSVAAPVLGEAGATSMQLAAVAMYRVLDQLIIGANIDAATGNGTGFSADLGKIIMPPDLERCLCEDCQSAPSPTAYLADLLSYVTSRLLDQGKPVSLPYLVENYRQPFADLPTDCAAVETQVRQVRICAEVLYSYLQAPGHAPAAAQQALTTAAAQYVLSAYEALLTGLGTSYDELRLARAANPADRGALAGRLGLTVNPYAFDPTDVLNRLILDPTVAPPSPQALDEANIERIFGLADTTRNPLSDGPIMGDTTGLITRWNLDGVTWGRNTDPDGTIYLSLTQPSVTEFSVTLYQDQALTQQVASGQLPLSVASFPASINVAGPSGLSGTIEISAATASQEISLGAVPELTAWQLQTLRADWLSEDHPGDTYTAGTTVVPLAALPAGLTIPAALQPGISYNAAEALLISTGIVTPAVLTQLLGQAPAGAAGADYVSAVNSLYVQSRRPPVIDPDVIGPDDFRVPVQAPAGAPQQPFDIWVLRRNWVDTQLTAVAAAGTSAPAGTAFTAMLSWAAQTQLSYGGTTATPWAASTPVAGLENLWQNLAQATDVTTITAITTQIASDLGLSIQAFNRLMDLRHQDEAAAADPRTPALTDADWSEVASLLVEAAKTRFFAVWRAGEDALALPYGPMFGPSAFIVSLTEPQVGDWGPVPSAGTPLVDPSTVPLTGLPDPIAGGQAAMLWKQRQGDVAALTTALQTTRETQANGFQAMLQLALGEPQAGPLPVDIDTLAQQLTDPDPAMVTSAITAISTQLFMTADQFRTIMTARTMAASANPLNQPTAAQWLRVYAILTAAETKKRLYPQWLAGETAAGLTYWMARKAKLPLWRASAGQRSQWHAAMAQRSLPPIIDPDLIGPADMVHPVTTDPVFGLWAARNAWLFAQTAVPLPASVAEVDTALQNTIGASGDDLAAIAQLATAGSDVTARLAQYTLTYAAFTRLMTVRTLFGNNLIPLPSEVVDFGSILIQVSKQRLYAAWQQAEAAQGIALGPDEFQLSAAGAPSPDLPAWRATAGARQAWQQTLQARVGEQQTVIAAAAANADAAEGATLTQLRDARVLATDAPGTTLKVMADSLTISLMIDAETGGSMKTTRIEQAIETLQDIMIGVRDGLIGDFELALSSAPAAVAFVAGSSRYDVFAQGPDNALWHKWWDTTWREWESLGGILTSGPAVTTALDGRAEVFVRGADGAVWHLPYTEGGPGTWASLGGLVAQGTAPGCGVPEIGSVDVFVIGSDGGLWQSSGSVGGQDPDSWDPWVKVARTGPLPTQGIASGPAVVSSGTGDYDIFVQSGNDEVWHVHYDGTGWSGWASLGGPVASAPGAATVGGTLEVFARRADGTIWTRPAQGGGWASLGGFAQSGVGAIADNVFIASTSGFLEHNWREGAGWHGWEATSALTLPLPDNFDAEWTWMGSYATWRAAIMVYLYPELLLDGTLRDQQTPGFTTLIQNLQQGPALSTTQAGQLACQYDSYFRDVCSIEVQASCTAASRLDDGASCAASGPAQSVTLLDLFGFAANSGTPYWSTYDPGVPSDYAQTFWSQVPGLSGEPLTRIVAATPFQDPAGSPWVLMFYERSTTAGPALGLTRYNPDIPGPDGWEGQPYPLPLAPSWTALKAAQLAAQATQSTPPWIGVTLPDGSRYQRQLDAAGTNWADADWVRVGSWEPWTSLVSANVTSGQPITAVSPASGQIQLFWVDYSGDGSANIVHTVSITDGTPGSITRIDSSFTTWNLCPPEYTPLRANYQAPLLAVARPGHIDLIALAASGDTGFSVGGSGAVNNFPGIGGDLYVVNDVYWTWWDVNEDGGQWHDFQRISSGTMDDPAAPLYLGGYVFQQMAAVVCGDTVFLFVIKNDGSLYLTTLAGVSGANDWTSWTNVTYPANLANPPGTQPPLSADPPFNPDLVLSAVARDPQHIDVTVTDHDGTPWVLSWTSGESWENNPNWTQLAASSARMVPPTALAEGPDAVDLFYFPPLNVFTFGSTMLTRLDYSGGGAPAVTTLAIGAKAYGATPVAALWRDQQAEIYAGGLASPGSSVWTASSADPGEAASWSAWAAISNGGGDISSLAQPWSVAAVSQADQRTDLFVTLLGGTSGRPGAIYTTYLQSPQWLSTPLQLPPFSPVPIVTSPLDIPAHLSSSDLQARRYVIQQTFEANLAVPPGFTRPAPASTMTYLQEAYYFVPMYLANQLQQQGEFTAALDWYRTVYDYSVPQQVRDIYYGLVLDAQQPSVYTLPSGWLSDPLNPHAIAQTRRYAYTRYTVLQIVQCMFTDADSLFTTDTSEDDAQARTLYMTGLELLNLAIFSQSADPCAGLAIQVLDTPVDDPAWAGLLPPLADRITAIDKPSVLAALVPQVIRALGGKAAWPDRFAAAQALITQSGAALPASPTVGGVLAIRDTTTAAAYAALLAIPAVDQAASTAAATAAAAISFAAASVAAAQPANAHSAGADAKPAPTDAKPEPIRDTLPPPSLLPPAVNYQPVIDFWFCAPANPLISSLQSHAELCLYELRNGMNIAGMTRQLDPYSAPTDASSSLPAIGAGGQVVLSAAITQQPTAYPYATLIQRAQQLVQVAAQMEAQMLAALQQYQQAAYAEMQARQNLTVTSATVQLQTLAVQQAADSVTLAQLQQQSAQMQSSYWQMLQGSDIGSLEQSGITAQYVEAGLQIASAAASATSGILSIFAKGGGPGVASGAAAALSATASSLGTFAAIDNARASLEAQQDNWQFQYDLSQQNVQITGQQITIAKDQAQVAGQQLAIANLQAANATDTLNFLVNQFLNAPLYDWMAGVLQGVYSYFLQQATAVALLAEKQMAFERQVALPGFIKSGYWQPASANLTAALTPGTSNTMGLTGAERLNQDITELNEYYLSTDQRKLQLTKTISLAQLYPVGFQQFRETGVINFSTPLSLFDQDFPGHYLRLIQQVSVSVIALVPPGQGIKAILSTTGTSQVVTGPEVFQAVIVRTDPQSVAITTPVNATGLFGTDPQSGLLLPFQELGVAAQWQFSMPLAANQFDFSTLADVQLTVNYTALADPGYRAQVIQSLGGQVSQERPYSFVNDLPDQWYDLNNPAQTPTPMTVTFDIAATDFPANLNDIRIQQVILYFARAAGASFEVSVSSLQFFEGGSPAAVGGAATSVNGIISTRSGNAASWIPMIGRSPFGSWQLTLPDTQVVRDWFAGQQITDILLDITYTAETPPWPA